MATAKEHEKLGKNIIDLISEDLLPEDVFSDSVLRDWAEENGYVKE